FLKMSSAPDLRTHDAEMKSRANRQEWVVYTKPSFGGPEQVLRYLGRYTHRVAISNHRLISFDGDQVTFRWKDDAHGNKKRKVTLNGSAADLRSTQATSGT